MNGSSKILMLIRRELWEHRSLWIAPLVISGIILLSASIGGIHAGENGSYGITFNSDGNMHHLEALNPDLARQKKIYAAAIGMFTIVQLFVLGIVIFFYLLDCLLTERKDRSILFWKSLPISD